MAAIWGMCHRRPPLVFPQQQGAVQHGDLMVSHTIQKGSPLFSRVSEPPGRFWGGRLFSGRLGRRALHLARGSLAQVLDARGGLGRHSAAHPLQRPRLRENDDGGVRAEESGQRRKAGKPAKSVAIGVLLGQMAKFYQWFTRNRHLFSTKTTKKDTYGCEGHKWGTAISWNRRRNPDSN